jgi:hypothetical protein
VKTPPPQTIVAQTSSPLSSVASFKNKCGSPLPTNRSAVYEPNNTQIVLHNTEARFNMHGHGHSGASLDAHARNVLPQQTAVAVVLRNGSKRSDVAGMEPPNVAVAPAGLRYGVPDTHALESGMCVFVACVVVFVACVVVFVAGVVVFVAGFVVFVAGVFCVICECTCVCAQAYIQACVGICGVVWCSMFVCEKSIGMSQSETLV